MKIIIAGAGEVGFHLAKLLSYESLDITLIDTDKDRLNYAESHLDIRAIRGDAMSLSLMEEAKVGSSDLFIAVTAEESINITICALAKQLGSKRTIARISNIELIKAQDSISFQNMGVDEVISPEELAAEEIQQLLDQSAFSNSYGGEINIFTDPFKFGKAAKTISQYNYDITFSKPRVLNSSIIKIISKIDF